MQNQLNKSLREKQQLELSFNERLANMNQKFSESQRQLEMAHRDKNELQMRLDEFKQKFEVGLHEKDQEIEFIKKNHLIDENKKEISEKKLEELKSKCDQPGSKNSRTN